MLFPFEKIRVKPGTVLIETVLSGYPLYLVYQLIIDLKKNNGMERAKNIIHSMATAKLKKS